MNKTGLILDYTNASNEKEHIAVIEQYMQLLGKSKTSIIARLAKAGVYVSYAGKSKITGADPITKVQIVGKLKGITGLKLEGLDKAPKLTLLELLQYLKV